ncbi:MAG: hypothetical protein HOE90_14920 [Bacteriovoracaceae bacterium]|jgi:hypothetical protein|nr:hypothetical protein [Bacteriovoracaceae bacterium]
MKINLIFAAIVAFTFNTNIARAGFAGDAGNGEILVGCNVKLKKNGYLKIKSLSPIDFVEAKRSNPNYQVAHDRQTSIYKQVMVAIKKIEAVDSKYAQLVEREFQFMISRYGDQPFRDVPGMDFLDELKPENFISTFIYPSAGSLTETNDRYSVFKIQEGCKHFQLVNYPENLERFSSPRDVNNEDKIKISLSLWNKRKRAKGNPKYNRKLLTKTDKAAVFLHEAIYKVERDYFDAKLSVHTLKVVAKLFEKNGILSASTLFPKSNKIFSNESFTFGNITDFFSYKGKFVDVSASSLNASQWDVFGYVGVRGYDDKLYIEGYGPRSLSTGFRFSGDTQPKIAFLGDNQSLVIGDVLQSSVCPLAFEEKPEMEACGSNFMVHQGVIKIRPYLSGSAKVICKVLYGKEVMLCGVDENSSARGRGISKYIVLQKNPGFEGGNLSQKIKETKWTLVGKVKEVNDDVMINMFQGTDQALKGVVDSYSRLLFGTNNEFHMVADFQNEICSEGEGITARDVLGEDIPERYSMGDAVGAMSTGRLVGPTAIGMVSIAETITAKEHLTCGSNYSVRGDKILLSSEDGNVDDSVACITNYHFNYLICYSVKAPGFNLSVYKNDCEGPACN